MHYYHAIKNLGYHARLKENEHLFRYRGYLEGNVFRCVPARAHLRAQIALKSCAVGIAYELGNRTVLVTGAKVCCLFIREMSCRQQETNTKRSGLYKLKASIFNVLENSGEHR